jgi:hypothetical protein
MRITAARITTAADMTQSHRRDRTLFWTFVSIGEPHQGHLPARLRTVLLHSLHLTVAMGWSIMTPSLVERKGFYKAPH